jgi:hypothetical protein
LPSKQTFVCSRIHVRQLLRVRKSIISVFRWGNKYFVTNSPAVFFSYSFSSKKGDGGKETPREFSKEFSKMLSGDFVPRSPYTTWTFKIEPVNPDDDFTTLEAFKECDLELSLVGSGSFVHNKLAFNQSVQLKTEEHYQVDETINRIELIRQNPTPPLNTVGEFGTVFEQLEAALKRGTLKNVPVRKPNFSVIEG